MKKVPVSCNKDCGGGCPLIAHVKNGKLIRITNNPLKSPWMGGCVRGFGMVKAVRHPRRIRQPLIREGARGKGLFKTISWPQALDIIAKNLRHTKKKHGNEAIMPLGGSGACRGIVHNTFSLPSRFFSQFGGHTETVGNYSAGALGFTLPYLFGSHPTGIDPHTLDDSRLILLWGLNSETCRFGSELRDKLRQLRKEGKRIIVIDPRKTATVKKLASQWIAVYPGTDAALMAGILYVLKQEQLRDETFIQTHSHGFRKLDQYIDGTVDGQPKTPDWAASVCGVDARTIQEFARLYGQTKPCALLPGLSIQRTVGGEEAARFAVALQLATGNIGIPGGSAGTSIWWSLPGPKIRGMTVPPNPLRQYSIPVYEWADAVLGGTRAGYPADIKCIYNVGGNYLVQGSDIKKNIKALLKVDFSVCHDYFMTPTARYCDLVLPVTTFLERSDALHTSNNILLYSQKAIEPVAGARNDYDIFCELARRLGFYESYSSGRTADQWLDAFLEASEIEAVDRFKQDGIYFGRDQKRIGLAPFVQAPHLHKLSTPSGKIDIYSGNYESLGFPGYPTVRTMPAESRYPLFLVTPKSKHRTHSQNIREDSQSLAIHPEDARKRDIDDGRPVVVTSTVGKIKTRARVTRDIMPGVVCLKEGIWPSFDDKGIDTAGSPNTLTSTEPTLPSRASRTHSVAVEVVPSDPKITSSD